MVDSELQKEEDWDDTYTTALETKNQKLVEGLLARTNPEIVMPLDSNGPLSQAVILTLIHSVSNVSCQPV
jgi:hypothetical protein